jgi:hypothetical protein
LFFRLQVSAEHAGRREALSITENSALGHSTMTISGGHPIDIRTSRFSLSGRTRYPGPSDPCCLPHVLDLPRDLALEATAFHEAGHALVALLGYRRDTGQRGNEMILKP